MNAARFRPQTASEWWLALSTAGLIPAYGLATKFGLYRPTAWPLEEQAPRPGPQPPQEAVCRMAAVVNSVARRPPWSTTCLVRSLVLVAQLRRRNVAACRLRIGVRTAEGKLEAHAWVEYRGVPVNDAADIGKQYHAFDGDLPYPAFPSP